jgi:hypothetical protein
VRTDVTTAPWQRNTAVRGIAFLESNSIALMASERKKLN